jgi:hypothetical protein
MEPHEQLAVDYGTLYSIERTLIIINKHYKTLGKKTNSCNHRIVATQFNNKQFHQLIIYCYFFTSSEKPNLIKLRLLATLGVFGVFARFTARYVLLVGVTSRFELFSPIFRSKGRVFVLRGVYNLSTKLSLGVVAWDFFVAS